MAEAYCEALSEGLPVETEKTEITVRTRDSNSGTFEYEPSVQTTPQKLSLYRFYVDFLYYMIYFFGVRTVPTQPGTMR